MDKSKIIEKYVWDNSALVAMTNSDETKHTSCYSFFKNHPDATHIFPTIASMEYQAVQSAKIRNKGVKASRELYVLGGKNRVYNITHKFVKKCASNQLHEKFQTLRGMDLIYACVAYLEDAILITLDKD